MNAPRSSIDALILAGGPAPLDLLNHSPSGERATVEIGGRPMVLYILEALRQTPSVARLAVVAPPETLRLVQEADGEVIAVPAGETMIENLQAGTRALEAPRVLASSCDVPLVQACTFQEVLDELEERELEAAYPIVSQQNSQTAYPTGRRTYARLAEGYFTGGNSFVLPSHVIERLGQVIDTAFHARKNPLALTRMLGAVFMLKFLAGRLSISDIEGKTTQILGCRCGAIVMRDASVAFDVDKVEDYSVANSALVQRSKNLAQS